MTEEIKTEISTDCSYYKDVVKNEILIDGVNVAGCEHYCEKINTGSGFIQNPLKQGFCLHNITGLQNADIYFRMLSFPKCRNQSNCYYKQLKRLELERNDLQGRLLTLADTYQEVRDTCKRLEQENKELKCEIEQLRQQLKN